MNKVLEIAPECKVILHSDFVDPFRTRRVPWGPIGEAVYLRTYSQTMEDGRRERWTDTTRRVAEGHFSLLRRRVMQIGGYWSVEKSQTMMAESYKRNWQLKWTPPGRGLQFIGTEALEIKGGGVANSCGFFSTGKLASGLAAPFVRMMDFLMLGVGIGFDDRGVGSVVLRAPKHGGTFVVEDSREGWVSALKAVYDAFDPLTDMALPLIFDYSKVRPMGAPLKAFGGTASGPGPLMRMINDTIALLRRGVGQKITAATIGDCMNFIGACVVAGGIRRSSQIFLGSQTPEFMGLKDQVELDEWKTAQRERAWKITEWRVLEAARVITMEGQAKCDTDSSEFMSSYYALQNLEKRQRELLAADPTWAALATNIAAHPMTTHRWAANNSIFAHVGMDYSAIAERIAHNGEPGLLWLDDVIRPYGRLNDKITWADRDVMGANPCQPAWATILTPHGIKTFADIDVGSVVWSGKQWTKVTRKIATGVKRVYGYHTVAGVFYGTEDHRVVSGGVKVAVKDARVIDKAFTEQEVIIGTAERVSHEVLSRVSMGDMPVFDITVDADEHTYWTGGLLVSNCSEQPLFDLELCCLSELFISRHDDLEDWLETIKYAFLYAKAVTLAEIHDKDVNEVMMKNRRIGLSITGVAELYERLGAAELIRWLDAGYAEVERLDRLYSGWLKVPMSIKRTSVKPSGSVSTLPGVQGGIRFPEALHYMRLVRFAESDTMWRRYQTAGYRVEEDVAAKNTYVVYFPVEERGFKRTIKDVSLREQVALGRLVQRHWSDNMVSATYMVKDHEKSQIKAVLEENEGHFKSMSFLPIQDHGRYPQMPFTSCSREQYESARRATSAVRCVDTDGSIDEQKYCDGDLCLSVRPA